MQSHTVPYRDLVFQNSGMAAGASVYYAVILHVRAIADANVVHVSAQDSVTPNRRFFTNVNVTDYLRAHIYIGAGLNLRMNTAERSDHIFSIIVTQEQSTAFSVNPRDLLKLGPQQHLPPRH